MRLARSWERGYCTWNERDWAGLHPSAILLHYMQTTSRCIFIFFESEIPACFDLAALPTLSFELPLRREFGSPIDGVRLLSIEVNFRGSLQTATKPAPHGYHECGFSSAWRGCKGKKHLLVWLFKLYRGYCQASFLRKTSACLFRGLGFTLPSRGRCVTGRGLGNNTQSKSTGSSMKKCCNHQVGGGCTKGGGRKGARVTGRNVQMSLGERNRPERE